MVLISHTLTSTLLYWGLGLDGGLGQKGLGLSQPNMIVYGAIHGDKVPVVLNVCHVPDMNLQMCTPLGNLSATYRRSETCQIDRGP